MAARKTRKKTPAKTRRTTKRKATSARGRAGDLPASLAEFVRQVTERLNRLEKQLAKAEGRYRREWARTLSSVSRQLGRIEAEGERHWKKLTDAPRREAAALLRRLERAIDPGPSNRSAARKQGR